MPDSNANPGDPEIFMEHVGALVQLLEEQPYSPDPMSFLVLLNEILLDLAKTGLHLEGGAWSDDETLEEQHDVGHNEWAAMGKRLNDYLQPLALRAKEQNPDSTAIHMLPNDIAELYVDLGSSFRVWEAPHPDAKEQAIWQLNFQKWHWHEHLYRAMLGTCLVRFASAEDGLNHSPRPEFCT